MLPRSPTSLLMTTLNMTMRTMTGTVKLNGTRKRMRLLLPSTVTLRMRVLPTSNFSTRKLGNSARSPMTSLMMRWTRRVYSRLHWTSWSRMACSRMYSLVRFPILLLFYHFAFTNNIYRPPVRAASVVRQPDQGPWPRGAANHPGCLP